MKRNRVFIIVMVWISALVFLTSNQVEARMVRYPQSPITVGRLFELWDGTAVSEAYSGLKEIYERIGKAQFETYVASRLNELEQKSMLIEEDLGFLIMALKYEACECGWSGREREFLSSVVLPLSISSDEEIGKFLMQHLLWFYNYRVAWFNKRLGDVLVGYELQKLQGKEVEEQKAVFLGTMLGVIIDAISKGGTYGSEFRNSVTGQFNNAVYWALIENRVDGRYGTDDYPPTMELDSFNRMMSAETQRRPDKYTPVILAFKTSLVESLPHVDLKRLSHYPEIRIRSRLSLNDLTYECKKVLVDTLGIRKVQPWMDEEWEDVIQKKFSN